MEILRKKECTEICYLPLSGNCSAGFFWNTTIDSCVECPLDSYQDKKWQVNCTACAFGRKTNDTGSTSDNDCQGKV